MTFDGIDVRQVIVVFYNTFMEEKNMVYRKQRRTRNIQKIVRLSSSELEDLNLSRWFSYLANEVSSTGQ